MQRSTLLRPFITLGLAILLVLGGGNLVPLDGTQHRAHAAPTCRMMAAHTICILTIKRSAKNYWEYRASVQIDDEVRPVEIYNCRDRTRTRKTGQTVGFKPQGAGSLICQLLYR